MVIVSRLDVPRHGSARCPGCGAYLPDRKRADEICCHACYCVWRVEGATW